MLIILAVWLIAQERGGRFGRPPKLTPHELREALTRIAAGETQADNVDRSMISRLRALN